MTTAAVAPSAWLLAARPRTLTAAVVPVLVGSALAARVGQLRALPALAALVGALFIQIGTNLANDYFDFKKGADTAERVGPVRVTQAGLIAPTTVLRAAVASFVFAALVGVYLIAMGGPAIAIIGICSLVSGYAYTGGPYPLGYHGLGDLFVFIFFGVVAVSGTYLVQTGTVTPLVLLASLPVASVATALLVVNNLRDRETDARAGKRTLAVRWGERAARLEYCLLLAVAFAVPVALAALRITPPWVLLSLGALPFAYRPMRRMLQAKGAALNEALAETGKLQAVFGGLFALGLWLG